MDACLTAYVSVCVRFNQHAFQLAWMRVSLSACVRACVDIDGFCVREIFSASLICIGKAADIHAATDFSSSAATSNAMLSLDTMSFCWKRTRESILFAVLFQMADVKLTTNSKCQTSEDCQTSARSFVFAQIPSLMPSSEIRKFMTFTLGSKSAASPSPSVVVVKAAALCSQYFVYFFDCQMFHNNVPSPGGSNASDH